MKKVKLYYKNFKLTVFFIIFTNIFQRFSINFSSYVLFSLSQYLSFLASYLVSSLIVLPFSSFSSHCLDFSCFPSSPLFFSPLYFLLFSHLSLFYTISHFYVHGFLNFWHYDTTKHLHFCYLLT